MYRSATVFGGNVDEISSVASPSDTNVDEGFGEGGEKMPDGSDGIGTGAIIAIIVGAVLVACGGAVAVYWFVIKKKR